MNNVEKLSPFHSVKRKCMGFLFIESLSLGSFFMLLSACLLLKTNCQSRAAAGSKTVENLSLGVWCAVPHISKILTKHLPLVGAGCSFLVLGPGLWKIKNQTCDSYRL